jgi:hypothetical protein
MKEITFKTKFELGDTALHYNSKTHKLEEFVIEKISYDICKDNIFLMYSNGSIFLFEEQLFRSKQEFVESL